jgi:predicted nucleotidyltransferase
MNPQRLCDLLKQYPEIVFAYLYGSFVEGFDYHDIDVAVFLTPVPDDVFDYEMALSIALTRILHKSKNEKG